MPKIPYTHTSKRKNREISFLMWAFRRFMQLAKIVGYDVRLSPSSGSMLELYFHDDYPNMLLVDKYESR